MLIYKHLAAMAYGENLIRYNSLGETRFIVHKKSIWPLHFYCLSKSRSITTMLYESILMNLTGY